jgi:hypothetical protein
MDDGGGGAGRPQRPCLPVAEFPFPAPTPRYALVLDLPGDAAARLAPALARAGYRPVPLYNAAPAPRAFPDDAEVVAVRPTVRALEDAAGALRDIPLKSDAPPAFLLDADRRTGRGAITAGRFDNRSVSLPTDFPSAAFLLSQRIAGVLLVRDDRLTPQADLAHTLLRYQDAGLPILARSLADPHAAPAAIAVTRPRWYRRAFGRFLATLGLRRHPLGGFGGTLPEPSAG